MGNFDKKLGLARPPPLVGTKSQVYPKKLLDGSPKLTRDMRRCLEIWFKDLTMKVVWLTFELAQRKLLPIWRIGENAADKGRQRYFGEGWFLVVR